MKYFQTTKKLFLLILLISLINFVYSIKIFSHIFYNIKGKLECVTFIPSKNSTIPLNVQITPIANVQIQLWDEDARIKLPFGLILDGDDFLGDTTSQNDGTFHLTANPDSESFGFGDLEPYLVIKHKCTGNSQNELTEECWLSSRYDLSALPAEKLTLGIRLGEGSRLKTEKIC